MMRSLSYDHIRRLMMSLLKWNILHSSQTEYNGFVCSYLGIVFPFIYSHNFKRGQFNHLFRRANHFGWNKRNYTSFLKFVIILNIKCYNYFNCIWICWTILLTFWSPKLLKRVLINSTWILYSKIMKLQHINRNTKWGNSLGAKKSVRSLPEYWIWPTFHATSEE